MAAELRKLGADGRRGRRLHRGARRPQRWRAAAIHTYDDHRMAMCLSLAAFNAARRCAPARAGAHPRSALRRPRPFPTTSRPCSASSQADAERHPGDHVDGPTASGKGTLASARGRSARLPPPRLGRAVPRHRAGRAARGVGDRRRAGAGARWPRALDLRFDGERDPARRRGRHRRAAPRGRRRAGLAHLRLARGARRRCTTCSCRSAALPGLVADGRDMGTVDLPRRAAQGLPHRQRRHARRAAA